MRQPGWETFQQYLNALCEVDRSLLERGAYDKAGHDLSDVYRGKIRTFKELISFRDAVMAQKEKLDQEKKEPQDGVEQSNKG